MGRMCWCRISDQRKSSSRWEEETQIYLCTIAERLTHCLHLCCFRRRWCAAVSSPSTAGWSLQPSEEWYVFKISPMQTTISAASPTFWWEYGFVLVVYQSELDFDWEWWRSSVPPIADFTLFVPPNLSRLQWWMINSPLGYVSAVSGVAVKNSER